MNCEKCHFGKYYYCSNCGKEAIEYWDDDGGDFLCNDCDVIGADHAIYSIVCPYCEGKSYSKTVKFDPNSLSLLDRAKRIISGIDDYNEGFGRRYFKIMYNGESFLITPLNYFNNLVSVYCYIRNDDFQIELNKIEDVTIITKNFWYRQKVSGYMMDMPSTIKFLKKEKSIQDDELVRVYLRMREFDFKNPKKRL